MVIALPDYRLRSAIEELASKQAKSSNEIITKTVVNQENNSNTSSTTYVVKKAKAELIKCPNCQRVQTSDRKTCWDCGAELD